MGKEKSARAVTKLDKQIGALIRQRRLDAGETLERLAYALGITHQQLQKYETAQNRVSASRLCEIASALRVDVGMFYPEARR